MGNLRRGSKVIAFPSGTDVSQQDLVEEEWLHKKAVEALANWRRKRQLIRARLEAGALVEPGLRLARVEQRKTLVIH